MRVFICSILHSAISIYNHFRMNCFPSFQDLFVDIDRVHRCYMEDDDSKLYCFVHMRAVWCEIENVGKISIGRRSGYQELKFRLLFDFNTSVVGTLFISFGHGYA